MLMGDYPGLGEWRFSALVEADGHRLLLDTGAQSVREPGSTGLPTSVLPSPPVVTALTEPCRVSDIG